MVPMPLDTPQSPPPPQQLPPGAMLDYSHPSAAHSRPGIIIAVGVISIVVACISGLANLSGALSGMAFMMMSRAQTPATPTPAPATTTAAATTPAAPAPVAGGPMATPFSNVDTIPTALSIVTSVLGLALALYLLVAGIFMLRASPYAVKLHWWYVALKIPLVVATTAVTVWMWSGLMKSMLATMPAPAAAPAAATMQSWMMHITTFIGALLSLAYPIALIFVLRSRTVRNYFNAVHA
jgi:hypothetical protein